MLSERRFVRQSRLVEYACIHMHSVHLPRSTVLVEKKHRQQRNIAAHCSSRNITPGFDLRGTIVFVGNFGGVIYGGHDLPLAGSVAKRAA